MSLQVVCPGCGVGFHAKDEWAGKQAKCPKCGTAILIGAPSPSSAAPSSTPSSSSITQESAKPQTAASETRTSAPHSDETKQAGSASKPIARAKRLAPTTPQHGAVPPHDTYGAVLPQCAPLPGAYGPQQQHPQQPFAPPADTPPQIDIQVVSGKTPAKKGKDASTAASIKAQNPAPNAAPGDAKRPPNVKLIAACGVGGVALILVGVLIFRGDNSGNDVETPSIPPNTAVAKTQVPATNSVNAPTKPGNEDLADVVARIKSSIVLLKLMDSEGETLGLGTGFIINKQGHVVTNYHVIRGGMRARATYSNALGSEVKAVLAVDEARDLAIVQLEFPPEGVVPLELYPDAQLREGTKVIAIGHPRGLDYSVTDGIVSALRTTGELPEDARDFLNAPLDQKWIQTTAAISGGNSGGPLMLPDGRVVGINTWTAGGENLGFAGHVRYIVDLRAKIATTTPQTLESYNASHGGLDRAIVSQIDAFNVGYGEILRQAEEADWEPSSDENKELIQRAAGGTAFSRPRGLMNKELNELGRKFAARSWDYGRHVQALNGFTIDILTNNPGPVMFFGKVVRTFEETHISRVQILDRGFFVDVYEFVDPGKHRNLGETLLVMGMRPPGLDTPIQRIAAGMVVNVSLPKPPLDTSLAQLRDFVHYNVDCEERQELIANPRRNFEQVRFSTQAEPQLIYTVKLNTSGQGFDAVRLPASTGEPDDEVVWLAAIPPNELGAWGITSVDGIIPTGVDRFDTVEDYRPANLSLPSRNETLLVHVSGQELMDSRRHLLWFEFRSNRPVEITLTGVYRPRFSARPSKDELFAALGLPAASGEQTRRSQQVFSKAPFAGASVDNQPTVPGVPLRSRATRAPSGSPPQLSPSAGGKVASTVNPSVPIGKSPALPAKSTIATRQSRYLIGSPSGQTIPLPRSELPLTFNATVTRVEIGFGTNAALTLESPANYQRPLTAAEASDAAAQIELLRRCQATTVCAAPPEGEVIGAPTQIKVVGPASAENTASFIPQGVFFESGSVLPAEDLAKLGQLKNTTIVSVRNNTADEKALAALISLPRLNDLVVQNVAAGDAPLKQLAGTRIVTLFYDYTNLTNGGVAAIGKATRLTQLSLRGTKIDNGCLKEIAQLQNLKYLDLSESNVTESGLAVLTRLPTLQILVLAKIQIGPAGLAQIKAIKSLQTLYLDSGALTDAMVVQLSQMPQLKALFLKRSGPTPDQVDRLKKALPGCAITF